jgi:hypothetical protein
MHYLFLIYLVTTTLHVSGLVVAHHQEVAMYICDNWYVVYVLVVYRRASAWFHYTLISRCKVNKTLHLCTLPSLVTILLTLSRL